MKVVAGQGNCDSSYLTLAAAGDLTAQIEIKRSRFLAVLRRVEDESAARALVAHLRSEHHDARHHCSAFILGPTPSTERSNDDGEPSGTAGAPMLEVLRGAGLSDVAAVVVRWFGGVKLGTGGLARAYAESLSAVLEGAPLVRRSEQDLVEVSIPHADAGRVEAELRAHGTVVLGTSYDRQAVLQLATDDVQQLRSVVAATTRGAAEPHVVGTRWVDLPLA